MPQTERIIIRHIERHRKRRRRSSCRGSRARAPAHNAWMHYAENTLAKRPYFAGSQFTAADIMMHFALKLGAPIATGADFSVKTILSGEIDYYRDFPNAKAFMQRVQTRPAFQRAMKSTMPKGPPTM